MRNLNRILLFVMVFLIIVLTALASSFIWTWTSSTAKPVYVENNIENVNDEKKENDLPEYIVVKVEEKEEKDETEKVEKKESIAEDSKNNQNKNEVNNENKPTFKQVNEKVYGINNVNIRVEPDVSSKSIGVLKKGEEITRTGIGSNGWDRVIYNNNIRYISHKYLSIQKVEVPKENVTTSTVKKEEKVTVTTEKTEQKKNNTSTIKNNTSRYITASMSSANQYPEGWLEDFNNKIISLQKEFPKGYYWNHMGSTVNSNSVTKTPCNNKVNGNKYCNEYQGKSTQACGFSIGRQCAGFSSMLSDRIFGKNANARIFYNYDELKIGDQARINNNSHTVFIIDKTDDYVIVAECNADYKTCVINWGRKIPRSKLTGFYITRR